MAVDQKGANRTSVDAIPAVNILARDAGGKARGITDTLTLAAQIQNSTATMGTDVPPHCRIVRYSLIHAALGSSTSYKLDHVDSAGSSTVVFATASTSSAGDIAGNVSIPLTLGGSLVLTQTAVATGAGAITLYVEYLVD